MITDNRLILDSILDVLRSDETLTGYVKEIGHGAMTIARKRFPFIVIGNFHIRQEMMLEGSLHLLYTIEMFCGTKSLVTGNAYLGNDNGVKGINDLCDDICNAIMGNTFNGIFYPVCKMSSNPNYKRDKGETLHLGMVTFTAKHIAFL